MSSRPPEDISGKIRRVELREAAGA